MAFNIGAGLSAMGASVANTAGSEALEMQKSNLESQRDILADQLAGARESKGRQEAGEIAATAAGKQQEFEKGLENTKEIFAASESSKQLSAQEQEETARNLTTLSAAHISAAASTAVAKMETDANSTETGFDAKTGNIVRYNKVTGASSTLTNPDGTPLTLTNPAQWQGVRDLTSKTDAEIRSIGTTYSAIVRADQDNIDKALAAAGGDEKNSDVAEAKQRMADHLVGWAQAKADANGQLTDQINSYLHPGEAAPAASPSIGATGLPPPGAGGSIFMNQTGSGAAPNVPNLNKYMPGQ